MKAARAPKKAARAARAPRAAERTVLITGADSFFGRQVAAAIAAEPHCGRILLLADQPAALKPRRSRSVRIDPRDLEIADLIRKERVHTVYHLDYRETYRKDEEVFDRNVIGTLTVLSACAEAGVKKVIVRSSLSVYGANHNNPNFMPERRPLRSRPYLQWVKDLAEMERYIGDIRTQRPEMCVTILRLAHVVGPQCDSPLMRYVRMRPVPVLMGFEPLFQVLHESDAVAALIQASRVDVPGPVNVAPDGVLPLFKLLRLARARMLPLFHPLAYAAAQHLRELPVIGKLPLEVNYLRYNCMGDNRRMKEDLGFQPALATDEAFQRAMQEIGRNGSGDRAVGAGDDDL